MNKHCNRFYDEGKGRLFQTFEMIALETWRDQEQSAFFITDSTIMKRVSLLFLGSCQLVPANENIPIPSKACCKP